MAPARAMDDPMEEAVDPNEPPRDYEEFFADLRAFHEERETNLDIASRVNGKPIDLHKLFWAVDRLGGYDTVSAEKLAWRKVGSEFNLGQSNAAAYAFALKTVYYKNLAAYAIKKIHKQEPPPKEILENISAKGGDLLKRTVENFKPPQARESMVNGNDSEGSGEDESKTPKEEKMDIDEPGSGGGRTTRGLRQQPPQRVLYQPDVSSTRQSRQQTAHQQSPQASSTVTGGAYNYNPSSNPNSSSFSIANYEPRPPIPLTLRPVITPGNNPALFREKIKRNRELQVAKTGDSGTAYKGMMLPGTGFDGPNIYVRTLLALRSCIPAEQDYALHHLVKISHERGDKYKFDAFPGLLDGLLEKSLEVGTLFYNVKWEVSYSVDANLTAQRHILDGMNGTEDLLDRIFALEELDMPDEVETEEFAHKISKLCEAGLVIRNMALLEDNAKYLSDHLAVRDLLVIILNLPWKPNLIELKHYALETAEQLTKYWRFSPSNPLYRTLLRYLNSDVANDRGVALTTIRAINRFSMNLEEPNRLAEIPSTIVHRVGDWLLLDDLELVAACLDFLYQYTAIPENVGELLQYASKNLISLATIVYQVSRLLDHGATKHFHKKMITPAIPPKPAAEIPSIPKDLLDEVMRLEEPERSSHWLRACFEQDPESEITQIALWQAYQTRFGSYSSPQAPLLAAAEFIKNVSSTFPAANAQVINGVNQRFIIKGIKARHLPMNIKGQVYQRCLWKAPEADKVCGEFCLKSSEMWNHMIVSHLGLAPNEGGKFSTVDARTAAALQGRRFDCHWAGRCNRFAGTEGSENPYEVAIHLKQHLPLTGSNAEAHTKAELPRPLPRSIKADGTIDDGIDEYFTLDGSPAIYEYVLQRPTTDPHNPRALADGQPLMSALVLRNFARNIPKAAIGLETQKGSPTIVGGTNGWIARSFGPIEQRLIDVAVHDVAMSKIIFEIIFIVKKGIES